MKEIPVVYEGKEILIVNKPAGLAVQGGQGVKNPLDQLLSQQLGTKVYPVHRLDKETAGLLVVALSSVAARRWIQLISSKQVKREYQAICYGCIEGRGTSGRLNQKVLVGGEAKTAETFYRTTRVFPLQECCPQLRNTCQSGDSSSLSVPSSPVAKIKGFQPKAAFSLLELTLGTGRTHQIRIHLAQSGCPILADDKYGNFRMNRLVRKVLGIKTLQLAATRLILPLDGCPSTFEVPLPPHMETTLSMLSQGRFE